ncbi:MAG: hypothetical protein MUF49_02745 [Oculatellaceae cyanobacterium Prado106]|jgi:pyruvate/2-oxoglutarate dehydrogenase complex dihydrolipoamide dehydrogenase (E3) component|nr:hypothetical protein [Oculatellaceae cyanobacterium Prado106]
MNRVRSIQDSFHKGIQKRLENAGVKVIDAEASLNTAALNTTATHVELDAQGYVKIDEQFHPFHLR